MASGVKWIKVTTDLFDDEKILLLEKYENKDSLIILWLKLLLRARKTNKNGRKEFSVSNMILTDEFLAYIFRYQKNSIQSDLNILQTNGLIKRNKTSIEIIPIFDKKRERNNPMYIEWRKQVFERDRYTCQKCGDKKDLQAHHILPWLGCKGDKEYMKYDLNNGIVLCRKCHLKEHGGSWNGKCRVDKT